MKITLSTEELILIAVKIEENGINFYKSLLNRKLNLKLRNLLDYLLKEEEKHKISFKELLLLTTQKSEDQLLYTNEESINYLYSLADSIIFNMNDKGANLLNLSFTDIQGIEGAMILEKESILFYQELLNNIRSEATKQLINEIINQEKEHLVKLVNLRSEL
ncbi:MAG: hypothetical protein DDT42_00362 [candidate division WS2 bacterium]|uniref:Rubrerythrin diiron-binding domain-containing protein n=1 Tax=Psychracetigena formicireducens TaxID=2986056 RepID=A0A9E2F411_PSYF1|nr:hypothetical protein [Candidatus Psychracetigena formicireducens]MBT9144521.1 hypothetical protein [Candidatus Psychracetigena formicireducens]